MMKILLQYRISFLYFSCPECNEVNFVLFLESAGLSGSEWHLCLPSLITLLVSFCPGEGIIVVVVVVESPSLSLSFFKCLALGETTRVMFI